MPILTELIDIERQRELSKNLSRWLRIDILIVADTIVSLGPEHHPDNLDEAYFGMGHLLGVLSQVASVTKAHRTVDPLNAPGVMPNFRFDQHDLGIYDQIWLLGYGSGTLPVGEQAAIAAFMNKGGGVFATGDHASLGSALAGQLPRIRSMRRWSSPPPPLGPTRVDTTQPDAHNIVVFENQSDDIPQKLSLKYYTWRENAFRRETYPHPLLCSQSGPIDRFPDHMHEGEVVEPTDLDQVISLGGKTFDEYPRDANGNRVVPEIVAWGRSTGRASPEIMSDVHVGADDPSNIRWTGTVGVYDGRRCGVGRIVVDSTWHHFFDINLIGDNAATRPSVTDPRAAIWRKGFTYSEEGKAVLAKIDQYFRNIVHWLSPGVGLHNRFDALIARVARNHQVREVLETAEVSAAQIGAYAWRYALLYGPPCLVAQWLLEPIREYVEWPILPWEIPIPRPDPGPDDIRESVSPVQPGQSAQAMLGGALIAFARLDSVKSLGDERSALALRKGAVAGLSSLVRSELKERKAALKRLQAMDTRLERQASPR